MTVTHVRAYPTLSPIDELQHLDYLVQASRFDLVRSGEQVGEVAMREEACRGIDSPGFPTPACDAPRLEPEQFQELGVNTAASHPPTYYTLTGLGARAVDALPGIESFLGAGRLLGAVWLGLGAAVTFLLARAAGAHRAAASGAVLLMVSTPAVLHASSTVNNDAPAMLVGSAVVLTAILYARGRIAWWWLVAAALIATSVKVTNLLVVGAVALMLLLAEVRKVVQGRSRGQGWRNWAVPIGVGVAALVPPLVWMQVSIRTAVPNGPVAPMSTQFRVPELTVDHFLSNIFSAASPVQNAYVPALLNRPSTYLFIGLLNLLLLAALAAAAWLRGNRPLIDDLAAALITAMFLAGPIFVVLLYVSAHSYVAIPARYGLSLVPGAVAVAAVVASRRAVGAWALAGLGAVGCLTMLATLT